MDTQTLLSLKNNPHYKMTDKQKAELFEIEKPPMIQFGVRPTQSNKYYKRKEVLEKKAYDNQK